MSIDLFASIFGCRPRNLRLNETIHRPDNYNKFIDELGCRAELEGLMADNLVIYQQALARHQYLLEASERRADRLMQMQA